MSKHLCRMTEEEARTFLEGIRWPEGPVCVHCGSKDVVVLNGGRPGLKRCKECRKQFTVTVGTIFERSHVKLNDWVYAFSRMCASKKGISALQLSRELLCQYKTAWFICHRIRDAMNSEGGLLGSGGGDVEVDETYVGGKPRKGRPGVKGRGTHKAPVLALVERNGNVRVRHISSVNAMNLKGSIFEFVDKSARIHTDEFPAYNRLDRWYAAHTTVCHKRDEYIGPHGAGTNQVECFFALIKRGVYGNFHNVSKKHLQRYCDEFEFRWNYRKVSDGERVLAALSQVEGKRLYYRRPSSGQQAVAI